MHIEKIENDLGDALDLVWKLFLKYDAPSYAKEGVEAFHKFITDLNKMKTLTFYGMYDNDKIIGVIATRNNGNHITLFFVDGNYHKKGIGTKLFKVVIENATSRVITVNSSVYAVEVYHKLGFIDTDTEKIENGIRFTPMKKILE